MRASLHLGPLLLALLTAAPQAAAAPPPAPSGLDAQWLAADRTACELAAHTRDVPMLERCAANLYAVAPRDGKTVELQWALALARGQVREARELVSRARDLLPQDSVDRMEKATDALLPEPHPIARGLFIAFCVLCLGAAGVGTVASVRRQSGARPAPRWWPTI
jgi:hypothetical protein